MASSTCASSTLWTAQLLGTSGNTYWAVWGSGPADVYVAGNQVVRHSADHGQTWIAANVPAQHLLDFKSVWGSGSSDVYVGGGSVWHSTDGGASWGNPQWPVLSVWGDSQTDLFGRTTSGLMHSSDSGASWSPSFGSNVLNVWGTSATDLYLSSDYGSVFHSSDDGSTWQMVLAGKSAMGAVAFGGSKGIVYGVGNSIIKTLDDGQHWVNLQAPSVEGTLNLSSIWVSIDGADIFAVGQVANTSVAEGVIVHSADGGDSWTVELQCTTPLTAVWGSTATDVYAVGEFDFVLHRAQ